MSILRYRTIGPNYTTQIHLGYGYAYDPARKIWNLTTNYGNYPATPTSALEENTSCSDELHKGPPYRIGGPLHLLRQSIPYTEVNSGVWQVGNYKYVGRFVWLKPSQLSTAMASISGDTAEQFGATAWNRFRPVKPAADQGQFLAELRDFPRMLKARLKSFKDLGSGYLNYKFGWSPFLRDLQKVYELQCKLEKKIAFIRKNNGKWLKRGGTVRDEITTVQSEGNNMIHPVINTLFYPGYRITKARVVQTTSDRIWFDAKMKYYIPDLDVDSARDKWSSRLKRKLYGLEISPSLLWELLPWTWLSDWFINVGDIMSNISNTQYDHLVAKYAFIMRHRYIRWDYHQDQPMNGGSALTLNASCLVEAKERGAASPFGFGVGWPDFTTNQLAILSALAIVRV